MPDVSPILSLPLIQPAQAQKHVTHNEALRLLDLLVQGVVLTRGGNTPPPAPVEADRHIVGPSPIGDWAGQAGKLAFYEGGAWQFLTPLPGWSVHVLAEDQQATLIDGAWRTLAEGDLQVGALGVNRAPDATDKLSVAAASTLLTHLGSGHQLRINKSAAGDAASLRFETGLSGRAEIGTSGSDAFALRVSATGSGFQTALTADPATGHVSLPQGVLASGFTLRDPLDATKALTFDLAPLGSGSTVTLTPPSASGTLATLSAAQTFSGATTVSGVLTASNAVVTLGTATGSATYGVGTGATLSGETKTVNLGTAGAAGSTTVVNLGSTVGGAGGQMVVNLPTVTFAASVTSIGAAQANLSVARLGIGGATADATNRLSVNTPAVLLNHAGAGIDMTYNKNAAGDDASMRFKTGFAAKALIGLLGSNDFSIKVGGSFTTAMTIAEATGRVSFPAGIKQLHVGTTAPVSPAVGDLWVDTN